MSVKPEPEQPKPRTQVAPGNPNLDQLQGMLNLVLLTAGRFVKEHQAGGGVGRIKQGLQRAVPAANERFNDALDELENDVRLAQAVLRRDLALLRQDRKKREAAAKQHEAERARTAAESRLSVPAKDDVAIKPEVTTPAGPAEATPPGEQPSKASTPAAAPKAEELTQPTPAAATETTPAPPADPLFDAAADSSTHEHEFDFDFEFGDSMASGTNNDGDIMDTSADMDFTIDQRPSLLRGLEDFANAKGDDNDNSNGDNSNNTNNTNKNNTNNKNDDGNNAATTNMDLDIPMPDLPDMKHDAKPPVEQPKPVEPAQPPSDDAKDSKPVQEAADTKPTVDVDDTTNDEPMETMTTNNLDDLFNLDDYENPEGADSAFDDAFFNFD